MNNNMRRRLAASVLVIAALTTSSATLAQGRGGGGGGQGGGAGMPTPMRTTTPDLVRDQDRLRTPDQDRDRLRDPDQDRDRLRDPDQDRDQDRDRLHVSENVDGQLSSWQLLSSEERARFHSQMRTARTNEERDRIRSEHQETIRERANDLGVDAPFGPFRAGSNERAGYLMAQMLNEQERIQFHQRMKSATTAEERLKVRNEMQQMARERAAEMGVDLPDWYGNGPAQLGLIRLGGARLVWSGYRIADRQHFPIRLPGGQANYPEVAHRGTAQGTGYRRAPADLASGQVLLVVTDQGDDFLDTVLIGNRDGRSEPYLAFVRLGGWIDDLGGLHLLRQPRQLAVDLAHALAAIDIIAILAAITIARCPADDCDNLRAFGSQKMIVASLERGQTCRSDVVCAFVHR